ncbi:UNVERIFIED_CONTAM: hypothetical protein K2H54_034570 [Gekko kuhli]
MLEPLPIQTVRTGSEMPKTSCPFMGPVVNPDGHRFGIPRKQDLHHQTRTPGTIMLLATGIALRRHAWLRTAHLPDDIKAKVEDLPFDGEGLFHTTTDQYLTSIDDSRKTAKRLGFFSATPSKPKQRTWTPRYQRRHNSPRSTDSWKGKKTYTKPTHQPKGRNQKPKRPDDSTKQSL